MEIIDKIFPITILLLDVVNSILHAFGCYLLVVLYRSNRRKSTQNAYLINVSSNELIWSLLSIIKDVLGAIASRNQDLRILGTIFWYIHLFIWSGGVCMVVRECSFILVTGGRAGFLPTLYTFHDP